MFSNIQNTNSRILIQTALKLGIKIELLDEEKIKLRLSKDNKSHIVTKKSFGLNPSHAIRLTRNKNQTTELLAKHDIPVSNAVEINFLSELKTADLPPFPTVLKPSEGEKGHDVYVGIRDKKKLHETTRHALKTVNSLIIQQQLEGADLRFFVLNGKVIGAARRHPPQITGDGKRTIKELIHNHNQKLLDERKRIGRRMQNRILNWSRVKWHLKNQGLSLQTILAKGKAITLYPIANFQAGGTVETIPINKIRTSIIELVEKTAKLTGLVICGIDIITKDFTRPKLNGKQNYTKPADTRTILAEKPNATVLEVNSDPHSAFTNGPIRENSNLSPKNLSTSFFLLNLFKLMQKIKLPHRLLKKAFCWAKENLS